MLREDLLNIYATSFRNNWDLPALSDYMTTTNFTYGEMAKKIAQYHLLFELCDVKPGDKVALLGKNSSIWVISYMASLTYGAVVVPILSDFNPQDAQHIINHSDSVLLFANDNLFKNLDFSNLPAIKLAVSLDSGTVLGDHTSGEKATKILDSLEASFEKRYPNGFSRDDVRYHYFGPDSLAEINYTSGTTGFSKGVMLTLNNLCGNVVFGLRTGLHYSGSRTLAFLPMAHAFGCAFDMLAPLSTGTHVTIFGRVPTPKLLLKALADVRPTLILCVPLILEKVYRKQIQPVISKPTMRRMMAVPILNKRIYAKIRNKLVEAFGGAFEQIIVGGAPLNKEVEEFLLKIRFPFTVGYGMTECAPLISYTHHSEFVSGSSGRILDGLMRVKILSKNPQEIPGEICVKGEHVMQGYYKNPEATEAVLDEKGWLHTGDMGTVSKDGTISIKGRSKTMILSANGQNIYPEEIEAKLNNLPYVGESLVIERGNKLVALVYADHDAMKNSKLTDEMMPLVMNKVREELNRQLAPYEQISAIELQATEFEKTPKKSIKRYLYQ